MYIWYSFSRIPTLPPYAVYFSQLIRLNKDCDSSQVFVDGDVLLTRMLQNKNVGVPSVKFEVITLNVLRPPSPLG
jgi:hypothetical protein